MTKGLETLVRAGLADLADEVRPVYLLGRVAATRRRRQIKRRFVAVGLVAAVATSAVGAVVLWPDPVADKAEIAKPTPNTLPAVIDLTSASPVDADASLRMIFQAAAGDGAVRWYGLVAGTGDLVVLPDLPELPECCGARLSTDGTRVMRQQAFDERLTGGAPTIVDTRTGDLVEVPWDDSYRAVGLSPDGHSIAVTTLAPMDPEAAPPVKSPWGLTIVDLDTGDARPVALPASLDLQGVSSDQSALSLNWSPDGSSVVMGVASSSTFFHMIVSIDSGDATLISNGAAAPAPWSPDGARLVIMSQAQNAYRVINADPTSVAVGEIVASGPTLGRDMLGWWASDRLLWFDADAHALLETDLRGAAVGLPTALITDGSVTNVLLAPSFVS